MTKISHHFQHIRSPKMIGRLHPKQLHEVVLDDLEKKGIRNLVWVLAPWVFVAITFKEWILVLDG